MNSWILKLHIKHLSLGFCFKCAPICMTATVRRVFKIIQKSTLKVKAKFSSVDQSASIGTSHYYPFGNFLAATSFHKSL